MELETDAQRHQSSHVRLAYPRDQKPSGPYVRGISGKNTGAVASIPSRGPPDSRDLTLPSCAVGGFLLSLEPLGKLL